MLSVLTARRTLGRSLVGLVLDAASLECTLLLGLRVVACCVLNGLLRLLRRLRHYRVGHGPSMIKGYRSEEIFLSPMTHPVPKVCQ